MDSVLLTIGFINQTNRFFIILVGVNNDVVLDVSFLL